MLLSLCSASSNDTAGEAGIIDSLGLICSIFFSSSAFTGASFISNRLVFSTYFLIFSILVSMVLINLLSCVKLFSFNTFKSFSNSTYSLACFLSSFDSANSLPFTSSVLPFFKSLGFSFNTLST